MNAPPAFVATSLHDELCALASRVRRLMPDHRRPERFFEEKDEVAARLRALADGAQPRAPVSRSAPAKIVTVEQVRVVALRPHLIRRPRHRFPKPPRLPAETQPALL